MLNSTVNASGNYVEVTIDHLSTFGIFGEEKPSESSSSSGSGGGTRRIPKTVTKPTKTETVPEVKEEKVEEPKETDNKSLILGAVVQEEPALEEKIDITVDLSKPVLTVDIIKSKISILSVIILLFLSLFYIYYRKRKNKRTKQNSSPQQSRHSL